MTALRTEPLPARPLQLADLFCGAGGMSSGATDAVADLGYDVELVCLNHWDLAVRTHEVNHPLARHYLQDIATLRPLVAVPGGRLDMLIAAPTCIYHSRARGGRPTSDQLGADPWHLIPWLTDLDVPRMLIENVQEFRDWGPVDPESGKPIQGRKGEYFQAWLATLRGLGYEVAYKVVVCADYGDPTTRPRLFVQARKDGRPIRWPTPTHAEVANPALKMLAWRNARDHVIDWSIPGQSIFTRKKPLAHNTLARILAGAEKHDWPSPYLVVLRNHMGAQSVDTPVRTISAGGLHHGLVEQRVWSVDTDADEVDLTEYAVLLGQQSCAAARLLTQPVPTVSTSGAISLIEPTAVAVDALDMPPLLAPYYGSGSGRICTSTLKPLPTVTTKGRFGLVEPKPRLFTSRADFSDVDIDLAERQGRIVVIGGRRYLLDITYRMLRKHELARAMSLGDYQFVGTQEQVIRQIGNAVPRRTARAMVRTMLEDIAA